MKNKSIIILAVLFITIPFLSCTQDVKFDGDEIESKLVINCLCEPEKPIMTRISKSYFAFDYYGNTALTDDVGAKLYVNGSFKENLSETTDCIASSADGHPIFVSQYLPKVGDVIEIQASSKGFDDVTGVSEPIPDEANFEPIFDGPGLEWQDDYESYDWETDSLVLYSSYYANTILKLTITDNNPNSLDYYYIDFAMINTMEDSTPIYPYIYVTYNDPIFELVGLNSGIFDYENYRNRGLFSDKLFDGQTYTIKIPIEMEVQLRKDMQYDLRLSVSVQHVSKTYYNYMSTYQNYDENISFFSEPVQIYTNVDGGFGIIGARNEKKWLVELLSNKK